MVRVIKPMLLSPKKYVLLRDRRWALEMAEDELEVPRN